VSERTDEMAAFLMRTAGELHRAGKIEKGNFAAQLNDALRKRWPDVQVREIEEAAGKFMALADEFEKLKPANFNGRQH
jgi:hypothetical protein